MTYIYSPDRHSIQTISTDRGWEVALYSAQSGRKLKVYGVYGSRAIAEARSEAIRNPRQGRKVKHGI